MSSDSKFLHLLVHFPLNCPQLPGTGRGWGRARAWNQGHNPDLLHGWLGLTYVSCHHCLQGHMLTGSWNQNQSWNSNSGTLTWVVGILARRPNTCSKSPNQHSLTDRNSVSEETVSACVFSFLASLFDSVFALISDLSYLTIGENLFRFLTWAVSLTLSFSRCTRLWSLLGESD